MADSPDDIRALMRRLITELFAGGRAELIPELFWPDVIDHNPAPDQRPGHDGLRDVLETFHRAFPDQEMELHGTLADGEFGVDFWTFRGTHTGELNGVAPTGTRVEFTGIDIARVRDGRIAEMWHVEDMATMWTQLGNPPGRP